jgi:hypothetical protein
LPLRTTGILQQERNRGIENLAARRGEEEAKGRKAKFHHGEETQAEREAAPEIGCVMAQKGNFVFGTFFPFPSMRSNILRSSFPHIVRVQSLP